jgi:hypothetical protein
MMPATHLRSTARPQARALVGGTLLVWTECGRQAPAALVDNEHASCPACTAYARAARPELDAQDLRTIALALRLLSQDTRPTTRNSRFVFDVTDEGLQATRDKIAAAHRALS